MKAFQISSWIFAIILFAGLMQPRHAPAAIPTWTLIWNDEFNAPANTAADPSH